MTESAMLMLGLSCRNLDNPMVFEPFRRPVFIGSMTSFGMGIVLFSILGSFDVQSTLIFLLWGKTVSTFETTAKYLSALTFKIYKNLIEY